MNIDQMNTSPTAAGKQGQARRGPWTVEQRERVRQAAFRNKPWLKSTGPRTVAGKKKAAANGPNHRKKRKRSPQAQAAVADARGLISMLADLRKQLADK